MSKESDVFHLSLKGNAFQNFRKIYFCLLCIYLSATVLLTPSASQCFMLSYQVIFILNGLAGFFSADNGCFHFVISTAVCS